MAGKKAFQVFHTDPDKILDLNQFSAEDFASAGADEKASMVQMHKSVSFWQDAWRRFRKNHVSMGALFVFILILLFSFAGPRFIEYSYEQQYRSAQKLGPMEYSETEQMVRDLISSGVEGVYATSTKAGSLTATVKWTVTPVGMLFVPSTRPQRTLLPS